MLQIKAAIFDLDGTLVDSMGIWSKIDAQFLRNRGLPATQDYVQAVTGLNYQEAAEYTIARYSLRETPDELIEEWNHMAIDEYRHNIRLKPHVEDYLHFLRGKGIALGVATSSPEHLYTPVLQNNGVYSLFSSFTTVTEVSRNKSFPDIYLLAAERLGTAPEDCAVFEDVLPAVQGAKAAGMTVVAVQDTYSSHNEKKIRALADHYILDFGELLPKSV